MQDFTKLKFQFYLGYFLTIIVGVLLTLPYCIGISVIRLVVVLCEILWDSLTFMPRAIYEFEKAFNKRIGKIKED